MRNAKAVALLVSMLVATAASAAEQKLTAREGEALDQFGYSVAISGDAMIVGSPLDFIGANVEQGSATIFTRTANVWSEQVKLTASDGAARNDFGLAVAIDGDTAVVGAPGTNGYRGSVAIYVRDGSAWTRQATLTSNDAHEADGFGYSVAIDGNTLVVGAVGVDVGPYAAHGAAYVFVRNGSNWTQQAKLTQTDGWTSDNFGLDVDVDGNTLVVSTGRHDVGSNQNQGAAWVFVRSGSNWSQQAKLTASDAAIFDEFGCSVALDGNTIVVGSLARIGANDYQGAAYIFERTGGVWTEQTRVTAIGGAVNDRFGYSVALDGDSFVVGSFGYDVGENANQGSVHVFTRSQGIWSLHAKRTAFDGATFDNLGYAVALSGDDIAAGAMNDDIGTNLDQGSVYVFNAAAVPGRRRATRK
jgi:hypothetical protein